ncbi:MAG: orotate phosphoribosyltransferase [Clostridiales bacterium]|nr:orotate phosphoribosyltransferase [Clostridiales bacterium]
MNTAMDLMKMSGAFLEGHFLLTSGKHSGKYCQCARLLRFPNLAEQALAPVARRIKSLNATKVCGPAMGGILVSYELARQLGVESLFTERLDGEVTLRRGFTVSPGDRVIIAEDVITTGKSTMETYDALVAQGANIVGVACLVDRSNDGLSLPMPVYSAINLHIDIYDPDACPLCKAGAGKPVKPGSRL